MHGDCQRENRALKRAEMARSQRSQVQIGTILKVDSIDIMYYIISTANAVVVVTV